MAGGEGRADGVDEPVGRTRAIDECLEQDGEQRRQALGDGEGGEGEPAASSQEEQSDEREPEGTPEPAPEPIERQREVGEERGLEVMHCLGPASVRAEGSFRYEDGDQDDEREHSAGCPKSMSGVREKRLTGGSRRSLATGSQSVTTKPRFWDGCDAARVDGSRSV
jgi:hypothetical protein